MPGLYDTEGMPYVHRYQKVAGGAFRQAARALCPSYKPAVRSRFAHDRLRQKLRSRRGAHPLRCRRKRLSRHARGLRRLRAGPFPSQGAPGAARRGRSLLPEHGTDGRPARGGSSGREAAWLHAEGRRHRILHELRRRGERGGDKVRPPRNRSRPDTLLGPRLPRPDHRRAGAKRRRGVQEGFRRAHIVDEDPDGRSRGARGGAQEGGCRGVFLRADSGQGGIRGRRRVLSCRAGSLPEARSALRLRRGAVRLRPHREDVRPPALGPGAGYRDGCEGPLRRLRSDRRHTLQALDLRQGLHGHGALRGSLEHLRPQHPGDGRGAGYPRCDGGGGDRGKLGQHRGAFDRAPSQPHGALRDALRGEGYGIDDRYRVRRAEILRAARRLEARSHALEEPLSADGRGSADEGAPGFDAGGGA